ncbi:MAG: PQQ-binding-like beta-propeller repeat protein [Acidobacteriota bacterium]
MTRLGPTPSLRPSARGLRPRIALLVGCLLVSSLVGSQAVADPSSDSWPQFRGAGARGVADGPVATTWSVPDNHNIAWRTDVPGLGHSSPVVWHDGERGLVFLTTAVRQGEGDDELRVGLYGDVEPVDDESPHRWLVLAYDLATGAEIWRREATAGVPTFQRHTKSTHANSTPAVDSERVVALFGSEGLYAYDHAGELLWSKDLGTLDSGFFRDASAQWGFGASPVLHDGLVIVQADVQKGSFLAAFDATDGRLVWKQQRNEVPTWSTPTVVEVGDSAQIVVNGWKRRGAYSLATGEPVWWQEGGGDIPVPTPFESQGLLFFTSSHGGMAPLLAVHADARGELPPLVESTDAPNRATEAPRGVAWSQPRGGSYMTTPLVHGDLLYRMRDNGVLTVFEAATGNKVYDARIGGGSRTFTASPVAADGHLYLTSEIGDVFVVATGREHRLVATNELDAITLASPAISGQTLLFRTRGQLVAVAATPVPEQADPAPSKGSRTTSRTETEDAGAMNQR